MNELKQAVEEFKEVFWDELKVHGFYKPATRILKMITKVLEKLPSQHKEKK